MIMMTVFRNRNSIICIYLDYGSNIVYRAYLKAVNGLSCGHIAFQKVYIPSITLNCVSHAYNIGVLVNQTVSKGLKIVNNP